MKRKMTSVRWACEPVTHFMERVKIEYYKYVMCRE